MKYTIFALAVATALLTIAPLRSSADAPKVLRHLEYSFTYGTSNSTSLDNYSGPTTSNASVSDYGTISVDVVAVGTDGGLTMNVSEDAHNTRSTTTILCVVFPTTLVNCDTTKHPNEEEMTLLRYLGRDFIDSARIDAHDNWHFGVASSNYSLSANYHIASQNGDIYQIGETRDMKVTGAEPFTSNGTAKASYDKARVLPLSITELTTTRSETGSNHLSEDRTEIGLTLTHDSLQSASPGV